MRMTMRNGALLGLALVLPLRLAAYGAAGAAAAPYLKLPMGVRGTAMGEAFSGVSDDISAIYYNAAGLTALDSAQLQLMHLEGFGGVRYENLGLAVPAELIGVDVWGTIGFSYTLVGVEDIPRTQIQPGTPDTFDQAYADRGFLFTSGASIVTASYAWQATKLYSIGATFKAINEKVDTVSGWGLAGDIGLLSRPEMVKGLSAGMTLQNVGTSPSKDASLPINLRIGLGYTWDYPFTPDTWDDHLIIASDIVMPIVPVDGAWHFNLGTEYQRWFGSQFAALRAGMRYPSSDLGGLSALTLGGGLGTQLPGANLSLDYAWVPYGELGSMHRFSLTAAFGAKPRPRPNGSDGKTYVLPPSGLQGSAGDKQAQLSWQPPTGKVDGYNLYLSYKPDGPWYQLNKVPLTSNERTVNGLTNNYQVYFAVASLLKKPGKAGTYVMSTKSAPIILTPAGGAIIKEAATTEPAVATKKKKKKGKLPPPKLPF